jgi:hypothetical protein
MKFKSVDHVKAALEKADYICSETIATVVFLAQKYSGTLLTKPTNYYFQQSKFTKLLF